MSRPSTRQEQARLSAQMRANGRTWVEIATRFRRQYGISALAALRRAHGWSQRDAADRWNALWPDDPKEFKQFSDWERWPQSGSSHAPLFENLVRLATLYQCSVSDCLAGVADFSDLDEMCLLVEAEEPDHDALLIPHARRTAAVAADTSVDETQVDVAMRAIDRALVRVVPGVGDTKAADAAVRGLENRVRAEWFSRRRPRRNRPLLILVGGYAGSGKTEFASFLTKVTGWTMIDKDTVTRPLTECLLRSLGGDPNDRHTDLYSDHVRPLEYRCLMAAAFDNVRYGVSTVVAAPFCYEMCDVGWSSRMLNQCAGIGVDVAVVWMDCDVDTMHDYIRTRGAGRDTWKLENWHEYLRTIDVTTRPCIDHFVVDNRYNAATSLADQAMELMSKVGR